MIYETPLPFEGHHYGPAPVCSTQPPPGSCPSHLISIHHYWAGFAFPLHEGGGNRHHSQVSAPAFGGASWTTNTCCPKPALLTAQPDVTSLSHLLSRPEQCWLGSTHTPCLGVSAVHRQAASSTPKLKRHCWGTLERDETEDHSSALF